MPFRLLRLPWEAELPELAGALRALPEAELLAAEAAPGRARQLLAGWLPEIVTAARALEPPALRRTARLPGSTPPAGVPARKWAQIRAFLARLPAGEAPILEWCSGKGHLARTLARHRRSPARCVERDERLAHAGRALARGVDSPVDFAVLDALAPEAARELRREQLACALHACGELHLALLRRAVAAGTRYLGISPCCYHLVDDPAPLSRTAAASALRPRGDALRLALQETVTARPAVRARRERLAAFRLGFDLLQRELRGRDRYLPVPPVPPGVRGGTFGDFVRWAAARKGLELPPGLDLRGYERAGRERLGLTRRLSLLRHLFRRPMELWLVLDRALFLAEAGYQVELGRFCSRRTTPRNLLLRAERA